MEEVSVNTTREDILADLRAYLTAGLPYPALAARAEAGGHAALARFLRAVQVSETTRRQTILDGILHHQDDLLDLFVCPHCGLLFIPDPPDTCPLDETSGADFIRVL